MMRILVYRRAMEILLLFLILIILCSGEDKSSGGCITFKDIPKELEDSVPPNPFVPRDDDEF